MKVELTAAGLLLIPTTLLIAVLFPLRWLAVWTALIAPFQAASVVNCYIGEYPLGIQPGYLSAGLLLLGVLLKATYRGNLSCPPRLIRLYTPLFLFAGYAVLSALIFPVLFRGRLQVLPPRAGLVLGNLAPLQPSATNLSQAAYLVFLVGFAFSVSLVAARRANGERILRAYIAGGILVSLVGVYQLAAYYVGLPYPTDFLYSNPVYAQEYYSLLGGVKRVSSTLSEPSLLAYYLLGVLGALLGIYFWRKPRLRTALVAALVLGVLLLSTSTTAYLSVLPVVVGIPVLAAYSGKSLAKPALHVVGFLTVVGGFLFWAWTSVVHQVVTGVVQEAIFEKAASISFTDRIGSDIHSLGLLISTWGLGVGWGSNRPSSLVTSLLSNAGIPGVALFAWFAMRLTRATLGAVGTGGIRRTALVSLAFSVLSMLVAGVVSVPDLTHVVFWLNIGTLGGMAILSASPQPLTEGNPTSAPVNS